MIDFILQQLLPAIIVLSWTGCGFLFIMLAADLKPSLTEQRSSSEITKGNNNSAI